MVEGAGQIQGSRVRDARDLTISIRKTLEEANIIAERAVDKVYGTSPSSEQAESVLGDGLLDALSRLEVMAMFVRDKLARIDRGLNDNDTPKPSPEVIEKASLTRTFYRG